MTDIVETGIDDLEHSTDTMTSDQLATAGTPVALCPFLETVDYSDTHWTVLAIAPGNFSFLVTQGNQVIGTVSYTANLGMKYRQTCNPGQVVRIMC